MHHTAVDREGSAMLDDRKELLGAVAAGHLLTLGVRLVLPVLLPAIRNELGISLTVSGALITMLWAVYALGQIPFGALGDRIGERTVLGASLIATVIASLVLAAAQGLTTVSLGIILLGAGTALYGTTRITVLSDVFEDDTAAQGILSSAGNLGSLVLPLIAGFVASMGWRYGFLWLVPFYLLALAGLYRWMPHTTSDTAPASFMDELRRIQEQVDRSVVLQSITVFGIAMFIYSAVTGMYPSYLETVKGLSDHQVPVVYSMFFVSATAVMAALGPLKERFGEEKTVTALFSVSAVAVLVLPYVSGFLPLLLLTLMMNAMAVIWPLESSWTVGQLPDEVEGLTFGLIMTVYILLGSTGSLVVGRLADTGHFSLGFQLQAVLILLTLVFLRYEW
ncbi:MAG: MFS transporter [Candidatus Nanohaloarchaea archaeon]|nr:MFS transporter [Candidatus Nanohaloarchaea archaeon]